MRFLAHWILAIAFLLRWEIKFWTPNMTYIISFLLNTKSSRWQARNLHIFVEIFLLSKGEKSDEKSLLVYEYSLGFKRNKASLDHLSNLTKKVKIEVESWYLSYCSWSRFLRWRVGKKLEIFERGLRWFLGLFWHSKIFKNLQEERAAIEVTIKQRRVDLARGVLGVEQWPAVTLGYQMGIRCQKKSG